MDGLSRLRAARAVGLSVATDGDRVVIKGPMSAGAVAQALLADKPAVMSALEDAAERELPLDWPEDARDHFLQRLGAADDPRLVSGPGSEAWEIAVAEANRIAAKVPVPEGGLTELRLIDHALSAFAPLGGLELDDIARRDAVGFPNPAAEVCRDDRACPRCYRSCWWSIDPGAELLTCGHCHPPAPHLRVIWHSNEPSTTVMEDRP